MDTRLGWSGWSGLGAAAVYTGATAAGSLLDPGYSQLRQHVSDLTATGASTWAALVGPYIAYNLLVLAFAIGLYLASPRGRLWAVGLGLLAVNVLAGLGQVTWFREDAGGVPITFAGTGHLVLAGISSLTIVLGSTSSASPSAARRHGVPWRGSRSPLPSASRSSARWRRSLPRRGASWPAWPSAARSACSSCGWSWSPGSRWRAPRMMPRSLWQWRQPRAGRHPPDDVDGST